MCYTAKIKPIGRMEREKYTLIINAIFNTGTFCKNGGQNCWIDYYAHFLHEEIIAKKHKKFNPLLLKRIVALLQIANYCNIAKKSIIAKKYKSRLCSMRNKKLLP